MKKQGMLVGQVCAGVSWTVFGDDKHDHEANSPTNGV